jgi:hypothetical protein
MSKPARRIVGVVAVLIAAGVLWTLRRDAATPAAPHNPAPVTAKSTIGAASPSTGVSPPDAAPVATPTTDGAREATRVRFVVTIQTSVPEPIAGAEIELRPRHGAPVRLVTGPDGTASMSASVAELQWCDATVRAPGLVTCPTWLDFDDAGVARLPLGKGIAMTGRVLDGLTGRPIAGAHVDACNDHPVTNDAGLFAVKAAWPDRPVYGYVGAPGHVSLRFEHDARSGPVTLWLDPGGRVTGTVRTKDGAPVADADVYDDADNADWGYESPRTKSDSAGAFVLDGLSLGVPHKVHAGKKGLPWGRTDAFVATPSTPNVARSLVLGGGASLTVVVRDAAGHVVEDAAVSAQRGQMYEVGEGRTGADGSVDFAPVVPGPVTVAVWSERFGEASVDLDVATDETKRIEVRVPPGISIDGVVVDDSGAPVGGASLGLFTPRPFERHRQCGTSPPDPFLTATTANDGSFHVVVPRRIGLQYDAKARGHVEPSFDDADSRTMCSWPVHAVLPDRGPLRIVLPRAATFLFELQFPPDVSRKSVYVAAYDGAGVQIAGKRLWDMQVVGPDAGFVAPVTARRVTFDVEGLLPATCDVRPVVGEETDLGVIALDAGVGLRGRLVDADGRPVEGATLSVSLAGDKRQRIVNCGADGSFVATGIPPGAADVVVDAPGFVRARRRIAADGRVDPLVVTLDAGVGVSVRVLDADGFAAACDSIAVVRADGVPAEAAIDRTTHGLWEGRVPAGRLRLVASRGDTRTEQAIDVAEDAPSVFTIHLAR